MLKQHKKTIMIAGMILLGILLLGGLLLGIYFMHRSGDSTESEPQETAASTATGTASISMNETTTAESQTTTAMTTTTETTTTTTTTTETTTTEAIKAESITLTFYEIELHVGEHKMPIVTILPENTADKSEIWFSSDETIASVDQKGNITANAVGSCIITVVCAGNQDVYADVQVTVTEPPPTEPPTDPPATEPSPQEPAQPSADLTYIGGILIANKTYALPSDYNPGLDPTCRAQFDKLSAAAAAEGLNIYLSSGFRSYSYQSRIYNNYVSIYGQEKADTFSARPGHSEHQTGLAIDVNTITDSFANTAEAAWLAAHAHEYGFIIRYPKGKEHITGYKYEPWHIRYLGVDTATAVYNSGLTLEEYLGITSCYSY